MSELRQRAILFSEDLRRAINRGDQDDAVAVFIAVGSASTTTERSITSISIQVQRRYSHQPVGRRRPRSHGSESQRRPEGPGVGPHTPGGRERRDHGGDCRPDFRHSAPTLCLSSGATAALQLRIGPHRPAAGQKLR